MGASLLRVKVFRKKRFWKMLVRSLSCPSELWLIRKDEEDMDTSEALIEDAEEEGEEGEEIGRAHV